MTEIDFPSWYQSVEILFVFIALIKWFDVTYVNKHLTEPNALQIKKCFKLLSSWKKEKILIKKSIFALEEHLVLEKHHSLIDLKEKIFLRLNLQ